MKFLDSWLFIIILILLAIFTAIDHSIIARKMNEIKQINHQEQIEHSLEWSRMLSRKQELLIDKMYEKRIIVWGSYTHRLLDRENKIWLKNQMSRKSKKANSED